jgi:uncharacterized protein with HEPN domain
MPKDEIIDGLELIAESIQLVLERFSRINEPDDFVVTAEGVTLLDSISMRLQSIGEIVKRIQKTDPLFLQPYTEIEWDKITKFRDLVSHHYERIDHEIIYDICQTHIPRLKDVIIKIRNGRTFKEKT